MTEEDIDFNKKFDDILSKHRDKIKNNIKGKNKCKYCGKSIKQAPWDQIFDKEDIPEESKEFMNTVCECCREKWLKEKGYPYRITSDGDIFYLDKDDHLNAITYGIGSLGGVHKYIALKNRIEKELKEEKNNKDS